MIEHSTVVVVDDDPIVRQALTSLISRGLGVEHILSFTDGSEAVEFSRLHHADVYIMDVRMNHTDGFVATSHIRRNSPDSAIILMSSVEADGVSFTAQSVGADHFLLKTTPAPEMTAIIRQFLERGHSDHPTADHNPSDPEATDPTKLTHRELEILKLLCQARSNHEIAQELSISEATVKIHVSSIMTKLHCNSRLQVVITALKHGICKLD